MFAWINNMPILCLLLAHRKSLAHAKTIQFRLVGPLVRKVQVSGHATNFSGGFRVSFATNLANVSDGGTSFPRAFRFQVGEFARLLSYRRAIFETFDQLLDWHIRCVIFRRFPSKERRAMSSSQILFATDFSEKDLRAFEASCKLAAEWNAQLYVLHVLDPRESAKSESRRTITEMEFERFSPDDSRIDCVHHTLMGDAPQQIVNFAQDNQSSLIVLGTQGRGGLARLFSGSVAEFVDETRKMPSDDAARNRCCST